MLLGADAVTSLEKGGEITVRSLGLVWAMFDIPDRWPPSRTGCSTMPPFLAQAVYSALGAAGLGGDGCSGVIWRLF